MFKKYIVLATICSFFCSCADSLLNNSNESISENNSSIIGSWTSSSWCLYEDYTCTGNCVGGAFADLWILVEGVDPRFTVTFLEDSTAQLMELYDEDYIPYDFVYLKNLDGSYSLIENGNEAFQFELTNSNILLYWLEDSRCIEFTLKKLI